MAPTIPFGEPVSVRAGDTWLWKQSLADYPVSEGWVLSYRLAGIAVFATEAGEITNDGTTFTVTIPATRTAGLPAGTYQFVAILTGAAAYAGRVAAIEMVPLVVLPNLATAKPGDLQFTDEVQLSAVQAVLSGRITDDVQRVMIGNQQVDKIPILELYKIEEKLKRRVWRKQHPTDPFPIARVVFR